eukprot:4047810-Prymnesium_polylepis.3
MRQYPLRIRSVATVELRAQAAPSGQGRQLYSEAGVRASARVVISPIGQGSHNVAPVDGM